MTIKYFLAQIFKSVQNLVIMHKVFTPKDRIIPDGPLMFLAGPINGAPDWQERVIGTLLCEVPEIYIASPKMHLNLPQGVNPLTSNTKFQYTTDWERHYLAEASKKGAIMFWLPKQAYTMPVDSDTGFHKPYARDTRGELGEWRGRMISDPSIRLVIGGEEAFDGIDVIKRNFWAVKPDMPFYSTLEETCYAAIDMCRR